MTDAELADIRARADAATAARDAAIASGSGRAEWARFYAAIDDLTAVARLAVPALLAEIDRLRAALAEIDGQSATWATKIARAALAAKEAG